MKDTQKYRFDKGMVYDQAPETLNENSYRTAMNMRLTGDRGFFALDDLSEEEIADESTIPLLRPGMRSHQCFSASGTYGDDFQQRPGGVAFFTGTGTDEGKAQIYLFFINKGQQVEWFLLYDDFASPTRERAYNLNLGKIDARTEGDGKEKWVYWIDGQNPLRRIRLHADPSIGPDQTATNLPVPNEPDCLYVQRLNPVDMIEVDSVVQSGGSLLSGSYQFAYRYFNSEFKTYSAVSLLTNHVPIIRDNTNEALTNNIRGYGSSVQTGKAIRLSVPKSHFHHDYYDSIQLFVVRRAGTSLEMQMLPPSKEYYGQQGAVSDIVYTGQEFSDIATSDEFFTAEAGIETASTIEVYDGRLFLGDPVYANLEVVISSDLSGQTIAEDLSVPIDPLEAEVATGKGYWDEMNNHRYRGYFRGEVYRFALVYFDKFSRASLPEPINFPEIGNRYNPNNHAGTWSMNWADPSVGDWKFADRQSQEGSLFSRTSDAIRPFGLRLTGQRDHPEWAYGLAVFRRKRVKNILGQTPIIHAAAVQGGAKAIDEDAKAASLRFESYWANGINWDYNGSQDTFVPRVLAYGAHRHLLASAYRSISQPIWYLSWQIARGPQTNTRLHAPLIYTYPLEHMATNAGEPVSGLSIEGGEYLRPIDMVALESFSSYRKKGGGVGSWNNSNVISDFENGRFNDYAWVYAPKLKQSYFYYNNGPGQLVSIFPYLSGIRVRESFSQIPAGGPIEILSNGSLDERIMHISKIDNLGELYDSQVDNSFEFYDAFDMHPGGLVMNQRSLILRVEDGLYDPTIVIYNNYVNGPSDYADLFGGSSLIDEEAVLRQEDFELIDIAADMSVESSFRKRVISPGSSIPILIANIEAGLPDSRYGSEDVSNEYIFTGAYSPISESEIISKDPKLLEVWGGDCFISRADIQVRNNAPYLNVVGITDSANNQQSSNNEFATGAVKTHTYTAFSETISLWVESEINGHYLTRNEDAFPHGFETRDPNNADIANNMEYSYPNNSVLLANSSPPTYFYNAAYSPTEDNLVLLSDDVRRLERNRVRTRVAFSTQKVFNTSIQGFDRFLANDFVDMDGTFGPVSKLIRGGNKNLFIMQHDGVAMAYLGQTVSQDPQGLQIALSSGNIIGYIHYLSDESESAGSYGVQGVGCAVQVEGGAICFDLKRQQIFAIRQGIQPVSYGRVGDAIRRFVRVDPEEASNIVGWYDPVQGQVGFFNNGRGRGITYLPRINVFESIIQSPAYLGGSIQANGLKLSLVDEQEGAGENPLLVLEKPNLGNLPQVFGKRIPTYVEVTVNGGQSRGYSKILTNVRIESTLPPDSVFALGRGPANLEEQRLDASLVERKDFYIANGFTDPSTQRRLRSPFFSVFIVTNQDTETTQKRIHHIAATFRLDPRVE